MDRHEDSSDANLQNPLIAGKTENLEPTSSGEETNAGIVIDRATSLFQQGLHYATVGADQVALEYYQQSLSLQPDRPDVLYHQGEALRNLRRLKEAITSYSRAIQFEQTAKAFVGRGITWMLMRRFRDALKDFDQAIQLEPTNYLAWRGRATILSQQGKQKQALADFHQALALKPDDAETWNGCGAVLAILKRYEEALTHFQTALNLQPNLYKAWFNQGLVQLQLKNYEAAATSFAQAVQVHSTRESWLASAWDAYGLVLWELGEVNAAIASFDRVLELDPKHRISAFRKLIVLLQSGKFWSHLTELEKRQKLLKNLVSILFFLRYVLLFCLVAALISLLGETALVSIFQGFLSIAVALAIVGLTLESLWSNRSKLNLVWKVYFRSGILTYVRAFVIFVLTIAIGFTIYLNVPGFMRWGWSSLLFSNSGNLVTQPFTVADRVSEFAAGSSAKDDSATGRTDQDETELSEPTTPADPTEPRTDSQLAAKAESVEAQQQRRFWVRAALIVPFWGLLMVVLPFWAQLEEKWFRQGVLAWNSMLISSVKFGLIHLLAGIPICWALTLTIPGFLFACRYKFSYHHHFRKSQNKVQAHEVALLASTADHTIYNAIAITLLVASLLLSQ